MKKCPYCGNLNEDSNIYCKDCSKKFTIAGKSNAFRNFLILVVIFAVILVIGLTTYLLISSNILSSFNTLFQKDFSKAADQKKEAEVSPLKVSIPIQEGELDLSREQHIELQEKLIECSAATLQAITLTNSVLFIDPGKTSYGEFCERVDIAIQACELAAQKEEELENITGRLLVSGRGAEKLTLYGIGVVPRLFQISLGSFNESIVLIEASPQNNAEKRKLLRELMQISYNDNKMMKTVYKMAKQLGFSKKYIVTQLDNLRQQSTAEAYKDEAKTHDTLLKTAMLIRDGAKVTVFVGGTILTAGGLSGTLTLGQAGLTVIEGAGLACGVAEDAAYIAYGTEDSPAAFKYIKRLGDIVSVRNLGPKAIKQLVNLSGNMLFIEEKTEEALSFFKKNNLCVKLPEEGGKKAEASLPDKEELKEPIPQPAEPEKVGLIPGDYIDAEGESITVEEVSQVIVEQMAALGEVLLPSEEIEEEAAEEEVVAEEVATAQGKVTARGKLVTDSYLEGLKKSLEGLGCVVYWMRETENHLEISFDLAGGEVTGSCTWQYSYQIYADEETATVTDRATVNLTGTYSGGETGTFQGELADSFTSTSIGGMVIESSGIWSAEMGSSGQISGHLTLEYPQELDFTASLVD